ncbi:MAG: type 4a pilus biogenesis protein PilO [Candidatus Daviesbacteria bacterium]|nr:type 4a pilus biogenesis protein PilO [Candidatus Daviesbacteria bacterium]
MKESNRYSRYFKYIKPLARLPIIKTYGPAIFSLLTMSVFIVFAIRPTIETIIVLQKKLADADKIVAQINEKTDNLSKGRENYQLLSQNIKNKIRAAIPDNIDIKSLSQALETSAKTNEASISALQIQPLILENTTNESKNALGEIAFTFNIEGSYSALTSILRDLKISSRLISIEKLSLNKVTEGKNLIMSVNGKAYFLK